MLDIVKMILAVRNACNESPSNNITINDFTPLFDAMAVKYKSPEAKFMYEIARQIVWSYNGFFYNHNINGERLILNKLSSMSPLCVFDVGANVGDWASMARQILPETDIHCFEIVPATYDILCENLKNSRNMVLNNIGLFDRAGRISMNLSPDDNQISTFVDRIQDAVKIECDVLDGDTYVKRKNISNIDFLKIDAEGAEHKIIQGFSNSIAEKRVQIIQFEYGRNAIDTKFLLKDFYRMLGEMGYLIGKLKIDGVLFKEYSEYDEDFLGPNYVACLRERQDLIDCVKAP